MIIMGDLIEDRAINLECRSIYIYQKKNFKYSAPRTPSVSPATEKIVNHFMKVMLWNQVLIFLVYLGG